MAGYIKDRGNNKYLLTVTRGRDINGKKLRMNRTVTADSYAAAQVKMQQFIDEIDEKGIAAGNTFTLEKFIKVWKEDYAEMNLKKSTLVVYERVISENFEPLLTKKLSKLSHHDVQRWINSLSKAGNSPKTVRNNYSLLRSILKKAVQWEYLSRNATDNIELPRKVAKEQIFYTEDDVRRLLDVLEGLSGKDQIFKVAILLALFGGLRKGEICGLDINRINIDTGEINICQTRMIEEGGGVYIDTPKTMKSNRTIVLPHAVIKEIVKLLDYYENQQKKLSSVWVNSPALIKNDIGAPLYPQIIYCWFKRLQKKHNLKSISLHQLRHTHVAMLVDAINGGEINMSIQQLSDRLGHSQRSTTLNVYSHMFNNNDSATAAALDSKFFKE